METIGYSTGSLARSDVRRALRLLESRDTGALELSALRVHELAPLLELLSDLFLDGYHHLSVHAPSSFTATQEPAIAKALLPVARRSRNASRSGRPRRAAGSPALGWATTRTRFLNRSA